MFDGKSWDSGRFREAMRRFRNAQRKYRKAEEALDEAMDYVDGATLRQTELTLDIVSDVTTAPHHLKPHLSEINK